MANRSYLYSLDVYPDYLMPHSIGLSESEYNIPLIYRILLSSNPKVTESILCYGNEKIAITADYDGGVRKLEEFFGKLPVDYKDKCEKVLSFLKDYKNRQNFIHLECVEIYQMEAEDDEELVQKNLKLFEEISNIDDEIKKALKRIIYDGDDFDLRELDEEYWSNTLYAMPREDIGFVDEDESESEEESAPEDDEDVEDESEEVSEDEDEIEENGSPKITRTTIHNNEYSAVFETVFIDGEKPIEMAKTVLTRAQSDCGLDFVFSESAQIGEDIDDDDYPIDSFNFYWALQYCNALSITSGLQPCYSIDGETNPRKWKYAPYHEYNSYTQKWNSGNENASYYERVAFNPNANGWRLPMLEECKRAAENDAIQKETIDEIRKLWVWSDNVSNHSAVVPSNWNDSDLNELYTPPEIVLPQYSIRICRNAGTTLPETINSHYTEEEDEPSFNDSPSSTFNKEEHERNVEEFWNTYKAQKSERVEKKESKVNWSDIFIPLIIVFAGLLLFGLTNSIAVIYFVGFLIFIFHKSKSSNSSKEIDFEKTFEDTLKPMVRNSDKQTSSDEYETIKAGVFSVKVPKKKEETNAEEDSPDYAGWWNYKPDGMNDFQQSQSVSKEEKKEEVGKYTHEQARWILQRLRDTDGMEAIRIKTAVKETPLPISASKFGGLPYWTRGEEFPTDEDGEPLYLLAQINFSDVPSLPDYPERGLLQIFVQGDDLVGCDFNAEQKNWRIVWRDFFSEGLAMTETELREMGVKSNADTADDGDTYLPFQKEYALSFEKTLSIIDPSNDDFDDHVKQVAKELGFPIFEDGSLDWFEEDDYNEFYSDDSIPRHQIGGYPFFTQGDARPEGNVLLFQMDSEIGKGEDGKSKDWEILWGDCGIANFFISLSDLRARNFTNVHYNWDCY